MPFAEETDPNVYVDYRACIATFAREIISCRLPPATGHVITLIMFRYIAGQPDSVPVLPPAPAPPSAPQSRPPTGSASATAGVLPLAPPGSGPRGSPMPGAHIYAPPKQSVPSRPVQAPRPPQTYDNSYTTGLKKRKHEEATLSPSKRQSLSNGEGHHSPRSASATGQPGSSINNGSGMHSPSPVNNANANGTSSSLRGTRPSSGANASQSAPAASPSQVRKVTLVVKQRKEQDLNSKDSTF
jgi:hypothetical protein